MKKQPERTALTRSIFIETFLQISEKKSVDKITVSEICKKAGYNRGTFYNYFNDTYNLLECIENDLLDYIEKNIVNQIGDEHPEQFFIDNFIRVESEKRGIIKLLFVKSNSFPVKLKEILIPLYARQMSMPIDDEHTIYKLDFYLSGAISVISRWVTSESPMAAEEYALLMKQLLEGMRKSELFPGL